MVKKKTFMALLKTDIYRALLSVNFIISIMISIFVMFISCSRFIYSESNILKLLGYALTGSGSVLPILCILPILPYTMSFVSELKDKALTFWIIRTGTGKYAASKFLSSTIAGFLSVAGSMTVFSPVMSIFFPLFNGQISNGSPYAILLKNNRQWTYILILTVHYSLSGALFAGAALTISTFIPNKFSTLAAPIVIYFVLMRLTAYAQIPDFLKLNILVEGICPDVTPSAAFLYKLIPVAVILGILLYITIKQIRKRIERT